MAQKSLPTLNKVNISLFWYVTLFNKYYMWFSTQTYLLIYYFHKYTESYNLTIKNLSWVTDNFTVEYKIYPVTVENYLTEKFQFNSSYLFSSNNNILILNLYFYEKNNWRLSDKNILKKNFNINPFYLIMSKIKRVKNLKLGYISVFSHRESYLGYTLSSKQKFLFKKSPNFFYKNYLYY